MRGNRLGGRGLGRLQRLLAVCLLAVLVAALAGCSDDAPPGASDSVQGKTPVVRPEDVQGRGAGGAAVLAPDYRQELEADLTAEAEKAPLRPGAVPAAGAAAGRTEPGAGRLSGYTPMVAAPTVPARSPGTPPALPAAAASAPDRGEKGAGSQAPSGPAAASSGFPVPGCRQLVLVVAASLDARTGTLRRFVRSGPDAPWQAVGAAWGCVLGRQGLGFGRGLVPMPAGPLKRQGDGRTPAGFFALPEAFGYAAAQAARAAGVRLPYIAVTDRTACVTDPAAKEFGRVVGPDDRPAGGFSRQERMVRDDRANLWGLVIGHNRENPEPGAGACVFVNVRPAGGPPTGGSIGCPEAEAATLAAWCDPAAAPTLVVLPQGLYRERQAAWGLP